MNVLVLGGNGFIGSHLVDRLCVEGHNVRVFDRQGELYRKPISGVEYYYGDFGNRALLDNAVKRVDIVFHGISTTVPSTSNDDPVFDVMSNVVETINLLEQCVKERVKKVVFVSSGGAVYGTPSVVPVSEDSPTNPESSYGITKLTIEKYLALFHRFYGLDYAIVRPSNPYGPRQNHLGNQGVIAVFMGRIAKGRIITEVVKHQFTVSYSSRGTHDVSKIFLDIARARRELDWEPVTPIDVGIESTWDFIKEIAT